jgi:hypothetical protein
MRNANRIWSMEDVLSPRLKLIYYKNVKTA